MRKILLFWICTAFVCIAYTQPTALNAKVEMYNGRPVIMLNEKPEYPAIYALTDVPGGRWSWEEIPSYNMRSFCEHGFRLVQVDLFFDHAWKEDGSINVDTTQMQLRGVLNNCPDAAIFIRFHVNPPKWWQQKNPRENTVYADTKPQPDYDWSVQRIIEDDEETPTRFSLASTKWINDASEKLKIYLAQLQKLPEANAIAGIQVASGVYGEWHYWGFINNEPDMSEPMLQYFRGWLKNKYHTDKLLQQAWSNKSVSFSNASLPSLDERLTTKAGIFRDPLKERKTIDYYEAQHDVVADDILHFCKLIKESWGRPIITGAFYGYFYSVFGREAAGGHLQLQKVLNSPYIDFLCGPNTYYPQAVESGEPYRSRSLINSVLLHGKLWLDEMDQQPPLVPLKDSAFSLNLAKSIATVRRNFLSSFTKGMGLWFYDFGPSGFNGGKRLNDHGSWGWWDEPSLTKDIGETKKILESKLSPPYKSDADVLLVHDTKTFYYTGSAKKHSDLGHWTNNWIPPAIFKSGVVHDVIHIDDMEKVSMSQYKVVVFINNWVLNDHQKKNIQFIAAKENRHLVFLYAPGYSDEKKLDKTFIESVTGMAIQQIQIDTIATVAVSSIIGANLSYKLNYVVSPLFSVLDKNAISLATLQNNSAVLFAKKVLPVYTSWFMSLPVGNPDIWRYIFSQAGAHIYTDKKDIVYSGGGILTIHTAAGGEREINLKNGKKIKFQLAPNSTILLDSDNGEILKQ